MQIMLYATTKEKKCNAEPDVESYIAKQNHQIYVRAVLQPEVVAFIQGIPRAIFQQDNAHSHVAKTVRDSCLAQIMQLLP